MIYTRKAVNYENRGNWNTSRLANGLAGSLFKEYVHPSSSNIQLPDSNPVNATANLQSEMSTKYASYLVDFKTQIEQLFKYSFRNFVLPTKSSKNYGGSIYCNFSNIFNNDNSRIIFKDVSGFAYSESKEFVQTPKARHDYVEVTEVTRLLKIGSKITIENLKFIYANFQEAITAQMKADNFLPETTELVKYLFNQNIISEETYKNKENVALVLKPIIIHIGIMMKVLSSIDDQNILIDNTEPYLLNLKMNEALRNSNGCYMHDFETNIIGSFAYKNQEEQIVKPTSMSDAFIRRFDDVNLLTRKTIVGEHEGLPIFSKIPKCIVDQLTDRLVLPHYLPIDLGLYPAFSKQKQDPRTSASDVQVSQFGDIAFVGDLKLNVADREIFPLNESTQVPLTNLAIAPNDYNIGQRNRVFIENIIDLKKSENAVTNIDIDQLLNTFISSKRKLKTFVINKLLVGQTDSFEWSVQDLTPSQLQSKHGLIPLMFKIKYDDKDTLSTFSEQKTGYYLILASFHNYQTFEKYTRCQKEILFFAEHISVPELLLYFEDKDLYLENRKKRSGGYDKYADNYSILKNLFSEENTLQMYIHQDDQNYNNLLKKIVDENIVNLAVAKPKVENDEINKINLARTSLKTKITEVVNQIITNVKEQIRINEMVNQYRNSLAYNLEEIRKRTENNKQIEKEISDRKNALIEITKQQNSSTSPLKKKDTYLNAINNLDKEWFSIKTKYQEEIEKAIKEGRFESNSYILNLAKNNVHIVSVTFKNGLVVNSSTEKEMVIRKRSVQGQSIVSATIIVDKVVKIKVDGNENQCVYGGPYVMEVTPSSLQVRLLNRSSLFGCLPNNEFKIHPHASTFNYSNKQTFLQSLYENFHRGCLGESSPYIYNACQTGDLTMLIVNSLVWLSSANSSDMWGRSWVHFPKKYKDSGFQFETPETIANEIFENIEQEENEEEEPCNHETYRDGACVNCLEQCEHEEHSESGICLNCGMYNEWADMQDEDYDEDEEEEFVTPITNTYIPYAPLATNNNNNQG